GGVRYARRGIDPRRGRERCCSFDLEDRLACIDLYDDVLAATEAERAADLAVRIPRRTAGQRAIARVPGGVERDRAGGLVEGPPRPQRRGERCGSIAARADAIESDPTAPGKHGADEHAARPAHRAR